MLLTFSLILWLSLLFLGSAAGSNTGLSLSPLLTVRGTLPLSWGAVSRSFRLPAQEIADSRKCSRSCQLQGPVGAYAHSPETCLSVMSHTAASLVASSIKHDQEAPPALTVAIQLHDGCGPVTLTTSTPHHGHEAGRLQCSWLGHGVLLISHFQDLDRRLRHKLPEAAARGR